MNKKNFIIAEGLVTDAYPNGMFKVHLDNGADILTYISGKIRYNSVRILIGDRVRVELTPYDLTRGRIIYRLTPIKSSNDDDDDDYDIPF
uniref:Translation initiation factor IF-1, chloroplastic n=2 Tax=Cephalotaxus harringtonia TaxID=58029 RepID=G4LAR7_CEPHW|nr:translation initiation factor 1 [Cephalotaxus harringtonia var. wilsoniana]YP_010138207.1 translation initiation factor 1 [Cephalotaxus harringtonia]UPV70563.1 translation initiation factor 1 [Cephalotaxus harringtonia var. nana]UPV72449.1 translation initiation factor 1 [Cephalotaxus sp. JW-2022a]QPO89983.1 translation initiation factor 1 [Cephalotaxus harringtonia]UPV70071.1 translation initiation factor 1 [Cephalotaxus harringtonia]UPV70645.1 translation initiation factor 1 [Cephalotaxu